MKESTESDGNIIEINEARIKKDLSGLVRETVEETLNGMLDAEADALCNAERYSRTPDRKDTRAGHYKRNLETTAGKVTLLTTRLTVAKTTPARPQTRSWTVCGYSG